MESHTSLRLTIVKHPIALPALVFGKALSPIPVHYTRMIVLARSTAVLEKKKKTFL
jgi:hypothetical protein